MLNSKGFIEVKKLRGVLALTLTSIIWGSSFPIIKVVIADVSEYAYTWIRSLIAVMGLTPYVVYLYLRGYSLKSMSRGGLLAGIAYSLGLWLQGWGTKYTTASNSAFITGLNVLFVHLYTAVKKKCYSSKLGLSLFLSIAGLYLLTVPNFGPNVGDFLVLLGSIMWGIQVILVSTYSYGNPFVFTFFEMMPALFFIIPDVLEGGIEPLDAKSLKGIVYLALICGDIAFTLQVYGQRFISSAVAAIILLLEPVAAATFAFLILGEVMSSLQIIGAILIMLAMFLVSSDEDYR